MSDGIALCLFAGMNANSLAVVFGPNLLKPYPSAGDYATLMRFLGPATTVIRVSLAISFCLSRSRTPILSQGKVTVRRRK